MSADETVDLLVVGAGPAGLAAATWAAGQGLSTMLLDEQPAPGGQIYRAVGSTPVQHRAILGPDYWHGETLVQAFTASPAQYRPRATVWAVQREAEQPFEVAYSVDGQAALQRARHLIVATGAQERPFPIPGWTLPGVLTAGAAQILLKTSAVVPSGPTVLAGAGPLLYLLAWQYLNAGVPVQAILETTPTDRWRQAWPHAWSFVRSPYMAKGLKLWREVCAAVPITSGVSDLQALGAERLQGVRFHAGGRAREMAAELLLLHQGVVPNVNLSRALGLAHEWSEPQACWQPQLDDWGASSVPHLSLAGDGAGIAGAQAAEHRGRLAAVHAAWALGRLPETERDRLALPLRQALARATRGRAFFEALYRPADALRRPVGGTVVCRCEEVSAEQVREVARRGCPGPNQLKAFLRCGMGPCQGRFCGLTVSELMAAESGRSAQEVGYYRVRFPTKPLSLGELATMPQTADSRHAVIRTLR
jgi:NADPH-dependent 2,4-dienoyl-CoA reductase/sulfur reductase-like enzyme